MVVGPTYQPVGPTCQSLLSLSLSISPVFLFTGAAGAALPPAAAYSHCQPARRLGMSRPPLLPPLQLLAPARQHQRRHNGGGGGDEQHPLSLALSSGHPRASLPRRRAAPPRAGAAGRAAPPLLGRRARAGPCGGGGAGAPRGLELPASLLRPVSALAEKAGPSARRGGGRPTRRRSSAARWAWRPSSLLPAP